MPEDIVDAIEDIINNGTPPPPGLVVEATPTQLSVTTPPGSPPPTKEQTAEIGVLAAKSILLPNGGTPTTQTRYNDDGSITIVVYLDTTARAILQRWYLGRVAAARNDTIRGGRALLQTSTQSNVNYIVVGRSQAEVDRYQRQLDQTLSDPEKMSEFSNTVVEGSTADAQVDETIPIIACSYVGHFTISPLYAPCNKHFLAYVYPNCQNTNVNLRTRRQLGGKKARAYWQMLGSYKAPNSTVATTIEAVKRYDCPSKYLQASSMEVGSVPTDWIITPAQKKDDCTNVNIYSVSKGAYLNVPKTCDSFSYVSGDGGRARFRVVHA